jgi:hypothetical protein
MGNLLYRMVGLVITVVGASVLAYLDKALYTPSERWVDVLVAINLPTIRLLTLVGSSMVGAGLWTLLHRDRRGAHT